MPTGLPATAEERAPYLHWHPELYGTPRGTGRQLPGEAGVGVSDAYRCKPLQKTTLCRFYMGEAGPLRCRRGARSSWW